MIRRPPRSTLFPTRRSSDLDHLHVVARLSLEHGQQRIEQPGVAGGGRGGEDDLRRLGCGGRWRMVEDGGGDGRDQHRRRPPPTSTNLPQPPQPPVHQRTCICTTPRLLLTCTACSRNAS